VRRLAAAFTVEAVPLRKLLEKLWPSQKREQAPALHRVRALLIGGDGTVEGDGQVRMEKAMEEMFAGFAADGETAGNVAAGSEATLHGIADGHVFILHHFANGDAFAMVLRGRRAHGDKIIIKNDGAPVHPEREDEVGVHHAGVGINHKVRVDPKIEGMTLARGSDGRIERAGGIERGGLQASALEIFDGVLGVFDDAA